MTIEQTLGIVLRRLRRERALSQEELSATSNLDRTYISLIECGRKNPTLNSICSIAAGLNVSTERIFSEVETLMAINGTRLGGHPRLDRDSEQYDCC